MTSIPTKQRRFLFLQGPHGPFFNRLGKMLRAAGVQVWRVGFNAGDRAFWRHKPSYIAFQDQQQNWPARFDKIIADKGITDLVLYGDTRFIHASAISRAKAAGITVHVFEEGYLRPYWVTYERGGSNGHSKLMKMSVAEMQKTIANNDTQAATPPAHWGDLRQHVFYGAAYHWFVMFANRAYRHFKPHRRLGVAAEFRLYLRRLLLMPYHWASRIYMTRKIKRAGYPYHLALLQLEHDSSFQDHSPFSEMGEFLELVIGGFAKGAPKHHHLVFKAHPLENGRIGLRTKIKRIAANHAVKARVHFVRGGKLAGLLDTAHSVVTVNSTAAQQALCRGIAVRAFGQAVYAKAEFISNQPLEQFFDDPQPPNLAAYNDYRQYLLETSQITGGFYSLRGRGQLMRVVVDLMLADLDPYAALQTKHAAPQQQIRLVN